MCKKVHLLIIYPFTNVLPNGAHIFNIVFKHAKKRFILRTMRVVYPFTLLTITFKEKTANRGLKPFPYLRRQIPFLRLREEASPASTEVGSSPTSLSSSAHHIMHSSPQSLAEAIMIAIAQLYSINFIQSFIAFHQRHVPS